MAQVSGVGTIWNLPNYSGMLYTADAINTPFLSSAGAPIYTTNQEFPCSSVYDFPSAAQPAITETASLTAPTASEAIRTQVVNTTQIFQEQIALSYVKEANLGKMTGINTSPSANNVQNELDFQTAWKMQKIARDVEYSFINGAYQKATDAATAAKTGGMLEVCAANTTVAGGGATLTKAIMDSLLKAMADAGAMFGDMYLFVNAFQKQMITSIYEYVPTDRMIGGANIEQIITDFARINVVWDRFVPADDILLADMSVVKPVELNTPGKGNFFIEDLAKTGASTKKQIFGQIGLDYGAVFAHGSITNLATS